MFNLTAREYATQLELWKDIDLFEGYYQISNLGHVKSVMVSRYRRNGRILKTGTTPSGYFFVNLWKDKKAKNSPIHRLVAFAFLGVPPAENYVVNHINGIKTDNRVENLEWCTASENHKHAFKMGLRTNKGEHQSQVKLTWEKVREIRNLYQQGMRKCDLMRKFGVSSTSIFNIIAGISWREGE